MPSESTTALLYAFANISPPSSRQNSISTSPPTSPTMPFPSFKSSTTSNDRRASWDYAEAHGPSYTNQTNTGQTMPAATTATPTAPPAETATGAGTQQRRPSWVERHLSLGEEDARRALGM